MLWAKLERLRFLLLVGILYKRNLLLQRDAAAAFLFSVFFTIFQISVLRLLRVAEDTFEVTKSYLWWTVTLGALPAILNITIADLIRAEGATLAVSIGTMNGCFLNISLNPFLFCHLNWIWEWQVRGVLYFYPIALLVFIFYVFISQTQADICVYQHSEISACNWNYERNVVCGNPGNGS